MARVMKTRSARVPNAITTVAMRMRIPNRRSCSGGGGVIPMKVEMDRPSWSRNGMDVAPSLLHRITLEAPSGIEPE